MHFSNILNVGHNEGKSVRNYPRRDVGGRDVDSESWRIFQKFLLRDNESPSRIILRMTICIGTCNRTGWPPKGCNGRRHGYV